jgi:Holliday junction resolvase-like predicted endonuclease
MNAKAKGSRNERRSRALLEAAGYQVTRAAGSLGEWDLIGISASDLVLVQVKTRDWPGTLERLALAECAAPPHTRKLLHRWRDGARTPDVQIL